VVEHQDIRSVPAARGVASPIMSEPFSFTTRADWLLCDPNGHMRNSAYLDLAVHCRLRYLDAHGFPAAEFSRRRLGPTVRWDRVDYYHEIRHLEEVVVELHLAAASDDLTRFRFANPILRGDEVAALVTSEGGWLDLAARRLTVPPEDLAAAMWRLPRTADFTSLPSSVR
jgi:acyl-CoA thioester hydrolase